MQLFKSEKGAESGFDRDLLAKNETDQDIIQQNEANEIKRKADLELGSSENPEPIQAGQTTEIHTPQINNLETQPVEMVLDADAKKAAEKALLEMILNNVDLKKGNTLQEEAFRFAETE